MLERKSRAEKAVIRIARRRARLMDKSARLQAKGFRALDRWQAEKARA